MTGTIISRKPDKIDNVEIYRGICALLVVMWHLMAHIHHEYLIHSHPLLFQIADVLKEIFLKISTYSVLGFFIISGFVITRSLAEKTLVNNAFGLYFMNRFLRIVSLCLPTTLLGLALSYQYRSSHHVDWAWKKYSTFTPSAITESMLGLSSQWNGPGWTLGYEWTFYLLVAVPFLLVRFSWKNVFYAVGIMAAIITFMGDYTSGAIYAAFLFGIAAFFVRKHITHISRESLNVIMGISLALIAWQIGKLPNSYDDTCIRCLPLFGIMIFALYERSYPGNFYQALLHLGKISFSLYIWHWPIFMFGSWYYENTDGMASYGGVALLVLVLLPLSFVVAHYSYLLIERNARVERIPFLYDKYLKFAHKRHVPPPKEESPW